MSRITLKANEFGRNEIKVNGRWVAYPDQIETLKKVSAGRWEGTVSAGRWHKDADDKFVVVGGAAAGGYSNEWYVHCPLLYGDAWIPAKSGVHAIWLIENC